MVDGYIIQSFNTHYFTCHHIMKDTIVDAFAGATAGVFARTIVAPIDRIKLLIQLSGSIQRNQQQVHHLSQKEVLYKY